MRWIDELALRGHADFTPTLFFRESGFGGGTRFVANDEFGVSAVDGDDFDAQLVRRGRLHGGPFEHRFRRQFLDFFGDHTVADVTDHILVRRFPDGEGRVREMRFDVHDAGEFEAERVDGAFGEFARDHLIRRRQTRDRRRRRGGLLGFVSAAKKERDENEARGDGFHSNTSPHESTRTDVRGGGKDLVNAVVLPEPLLAPFELPVW